MPEISESEVIRGVYLVELKAYTDPRGRFMETFRKEWFPQRSWDIVQTNRSDSQPTVLRGLHYHHNQVDYWYVSNGRVRAGLVDLRPNSPTYLHAQTIEIGDDRGLYIPIGVAHGFLALTACTLTYLVDNYYDSTDEYGIMWNDPQIGLEWGIKNPILSERDARNPRLCDILPENLPREYIFHP